jgi:hypothetical protein
MQATLSEVFKEKGNRLKIKRCMLNLHNAAVRHIQKVLDAAEKEENK